mmetsp:Transcript_6510/g.19081  ORF Transcript_6510/g.19081 Transcript_6510/m.19081 type:complete len:324 (-) Transcript_6510:282-1253(-)
MVMRRNLSHGSSNALANFESIVAQLQGRQLVVLLDYDGTLTPIVKNPARALLSQPMRDLLRQLADHCVTGVVSGRSLEKITRLVGLEDLIYAGSHGFDIRGPDHNEMRHQVAQDLLPELREARDNLQDAVKDVPGCSIEDNRFSVSVHYRNVEADWVPAVSEAVDQELVKHPNLRRSEGKKVIEIKPNIQWDKGRAVLWVLEAMGLNHRSDIFTVYIGDDTTDEDVFRVLSPHPECDEAMAAGLGVVVTDERKWTGASMVLRDPDEVFTFLSRVIDLCKLQRTYHAIPQNHQNPLGASSETSSHDASSSCSDGAASAGSGSSL